MIKSSAIKTKHANARKVQDGKRSPKNTPVQKVHSKLKSARKRISKFWIIAGVAILIAAIYLLINGGALVEQHKMAQYLKEKYGKEFIVENYRIEGGGIGVEGDPYVDAYPVDDSSLRFEVWNRADYRKGESAYSDTYPDRIWERESRNDIANLVSKQFGGRARLKSIRINSNIEVGRAITKNIPSYKDAFNKFGRKIYMTISLENDVNFDDLSEHIYRVTSEIRKQMGVMLAIDYHDSLHELWLEDQGISNIESSSDVDKYIKRRWSEHN